MGVVCAVCSVLTTLRPRHLPLPVYALGASALVQNGETKMAGWCVSVVRAGGDVDRLLAASRACASFVGGVSIEYNNKWFNFLAIYTTSK